MTDIAVLFSIKPKYCGLIISGEKTVEVRKTRPKIPTPFKGYIYCTLSGMNEFVRSIPLEQYYCEKWYERKGEVIGEFVCDEIISFGFTPYNHGEYMVSRDINNEHDILKESCLSFNEMYEYIGENVGYGYHISKLVIYDKPKDMSDFKKYNRTCYYSDLGLAIPKCSDCRDCNLKRPPQSLCYVQEVK